MYSIMLIVFFYRKQLVTNLFVAKPKLQVHFPLLLRIVLCFIVFILFLQVKYVEGQIQLQGTILESETKLPLTKATIVVLPDTIIAYSDKNGHYKLMLPDTGRYSIHVSYVGFEEMNEIIYVKHFQDVEQHIYLNRKPLYLKEVRIVGSRTIQNPVPASIITSDNIQSQGSGEIGEILRTLPNIGGVRRGGAVLDPVIRGFKFSQLQVYIDGLYQIEGGCPNRMDPTISRVDGHDIERIEVVKGPFALRYGPGFGGTIKLITHQAEFFNEKKISYNLHGFTEFSPNLGKREHIRLNVGNHRNALTLYGGVTDYGNFIDGNQNPLQMQVYKYNAGFKFAHRFENNQQLQLSINTTQGRDVLFAALPMDERKDNTWFGSIEYSFQLPLRLENHVKLALYNASVEHVMDNYQRSISDTVVAISTVFAQTRGGKLQFQINTSKHSELLSGIDIQTIQKDGNRVRTMIMQAPLQNNTIPKAVDNLWNEAVITNSGVFTEWNTVLNRHRFFLVARTDLNIAYSEDMLITHPQQGEIFTLLKDSLNSNFLNFSFGGGYYYQFSKDISAGIALGRGIRSPDMLERFIILLPVGFDRYDYLGNPQLQPEKNNEVDVNIRYEKASIGAAEFTVFYSYVQHFITGQRIPPAVQKPLSLGVLGVKQFYNADYAKFAGFEFAYATPLQYRLVFSANAAYTMGTMGKASKSIIDPTQPIGQQVTGDTLLLNDPMNEIPPFEANFSLQFHVFDRKLSVRLSSRMIASQQRVSQAFYEEKTPGVILFNASARYQLNENVSFSAGVHNIFDEYYYEHLNRRMIGSSNKIFEPGRRFYVNAIIKI